MAAEKRHTRDLVLKQSSHEITILRSTTPLSDAHAQPSNGHSASLGRLQCSPISAHHLTTCLPCGISSGFPSYNKHTSPTCLNSICVSFLPAHSAHACLLALRFINSFAYHHAESRLDKARRAKRSMVLRLLEPVPQEHGTAPGDMDDAADTRKGY